jgi:hypothetical protein
MSSRPRCGKAAVSIFRRGDQPGAETSMKMIVELVGEEEILRRLRMTWLLSSLDLGVGRLSALFSEEM